MKAITIVIMKEITIVIMILDDFACFKFHFFHENFFLTATRSICSGLNLVAVLVSQFQDFERTL